MGTSKPRPQAPDSTDAPVGPLAKRPVRQPLPSRSLAGPIAGRAKMQRVIPHVQHAPRCAASSLASLAKMRRRPVCGVAEGSYGTNELRRNTNGVRHRRNRPRHHRAARRHPAGHPDRARALAGPAVSTQPRRPDHATLARSVRNSHAAVRGSAHRSTRCASLRRRRRKGDLGPQPQRVSERDGGNLSEAFWGGWLGPQQRSVAQPFPRRRNPRQDGASPACNSLSPPTNSLRLPFRPRHAHVEHPNCTDTSQRPLTPKRQLRDGKGQTR